MPRSIFLSMRSAPGSIGTALSLRLISRVLPLGDYV
jgi:hypothetical protein